MRMAGSTDTRKSFDFYFNQKSLYLPSKFNLRAYFFFLSGYPVYDDAMRMAHQQAGVAAGSRGEVVL